MRRSTARVFAWAVLAGGVALSGCTNGAPSPPPPTPVEWTVSVPVGTDDAVSHMAGLPGGGVAYATGRRWADFPSDLPSLILAVDVNGNQMWTYEVDGIVTSLDTIRDGRLIAGVTPTGADWFPPFDRATHDPVPYLMVLRADGTPDRAFGIDGRVPVTLPEGAVTHESPDPYWNGFPSRAVTAVSQSPSGDLLVAGGTFEADVFCSKWGSTVANYLMRFGPMGSPDPTYGNGQPVPLSEGQFSHCSGDEVNGTKLAVLDDGSVLAATRGFPRLVKVAPDGSGLDTSFGDGGSLHDITRLGPRCTLRYGPATLLSTKPDGSILVGFGETPEGAWGGPLPSPLPCLDGVARLSAAGSLDENYAGDGLYDTHSWAGIDPKTVALHDPSKDLITIADMRQDPMTGQYVTEIIADGTSRSTTMLSSAVPDPGPVEGVVDGAVDGLGNRYLLTTSTGTDSPLEILALGAPA